MKNPIADILADQMVGRRQSRIPFAELCGFYAALVWGSEFTVTAKASGLDPSSIAHLKAAGAFRGGQRRYPKVRAEFERLGVEEFSTKYLTQVIRDRLRVATDQVKNQRLEPTPLQKAGVKPRADKYAGFKTFTDGSMGPSMVQIGFDRRPSLLGWRWQLVAQGDQRFSSDFWRGDSRRQERSFATSEDAYNFCRVRFAPTDAEMDNGEFNAASDDLYFTLNKNSFGP